MKISELWLREWANPKITREELSSLLTMGGLEVEEYAPVAEKIKGVIVGKVLNVEKHPEADRLNICEVDIGKKKHLNIVCGASNVKTSMKVPVAMLGAKLPNKPPLAAATIRGVPSQGMLCSASEIGLSEESAGLLELPQNAPIGEDINEYFQLDDYFIDISITPNRGDCLSVRGMARDVAALAKTKLKPILIKKAKSTIKDKLPISIDAKAACPHYVGRVIRNVKADLQTPVWLKERLRRSGLRSINPIVDVTNYVMLELGQPMHAFDLNTITKGIKVRHSKKGEKIALLDGSEKTLNDETLIIADHQKPLAIAGVMGGLDSSVTLLTTDILLESAYFSSKVIAKQRQHYGLNSDSAYRFERGVDPTIQLEAIERATQLILASVGGNAGPVIEVSSQTHLPKKLSVLLPIEKVEQVLGVNIPEKKIEAFFNSLGFKWKREKKAWRVNIPAYRFDLTIAEDLIEEIARLYGYDNIPIHTLSANLSGQKIPEEATDLQGIREALRDQGFHEIISYSFVDEKLQKQLDPEQTPRKLLNPITADMTVMRTNLWPGLINTYLYNKSRQQHRIRLFEIGACFTSKGNKLMQEQKIAGLISGLILPEQWGSVSRESDFFDLKGDIENLLGISLNKSELVFQVDSHPALHPGQTASIYYQDKKLGFLGALHPTITQALDISDKVFVFELDVNAITIQKSSISTEISKFPEIRRDLAILVKQTIPAKDIQDTIKLCAGDWLKDVFIFDVYQGKGVTPEHKSVALGLILQHPSRTLVDDEVAELIVRVIETLKGNLGAVLRS